MFSPFQISPSGIPYPPPPMPLWAPPPTPALLRWHSLHWGIEYTQAQGPLFPLISKKAILCHIHG
jgi:hypothetical protein